MADASPLERPFPDVGIADIASGLGWPADSGTILGAVYAGGTRCVSAGMRGGCGQA